MPPFLRNGTFVFFAADNSDFIEDTADGKGTTHGTITVIYQKADAPEAALLFHTIQLLCHVKDQSRYCQAMKFTINKDGVDDVYQLTHL